MKVQLVTIVWFLVALQVISGHNYDNILLLWTHKWKVPLVILDENVFIQMAFLNSHS